MAGSRGSRVVATAQSDAKRGRGRELPHPEASIFIEELISLGVLLQKATNGSLVCAEESWRVLVEIANFMREENEMYERAFSAQETMDRIKVVVPTAQLPLSFVSERKVA